MQKQIKRSYTTITIVLLALVPYIFSSCDNFLNAKNIKNEIEESIEIANSSVITYNITNEKGSGSVTPQQIKVKKKEVFELVYEPEENWQFICWEVLDKTSGKVVEDAVYFYSKDKAIGNSFANYIN